MPLDSFRKEVGRKIIHLFALAYLALYLFFAIFFSHRAGLFVLVALLVIQIFLEYIRLEKKKRLPLLGFLYDKFRREEELDKIGAEVYFILGFIVSLAVFDLQIATAAIFMSVFGDMTAALVGQPYGRIRPAVFSGKSLEGSLAGLLVNLAMGFVFLRSAPEGSEWWLNIFAHPEAADFCAGFGDPLWSVIAVMAVAASLTELVISKIDDNLTVPVISGFAGQITLFITESLQT